MTLGSTLSDLWHRFQGEIFPALADPVGVDIVETADRHRSDPDIGDVERAVSEVEDLEEVLVAAVELGVFSGAEVGEHPVPTERQRIIGPGPVGAAGEAVDRLELPHGFMPGTVPGGLDAGFDQVRWNAYGWNPIPGLPELGHDPNAGSKPSWADILRANADAALDDLRRQRTNDANRQTGSRISAAYRASGPDDEIWRRLRGEATPEQDAERDRLLHACRALKARIQAARTRAQLEAIDPADNRQWQPKPP